MTDSLWRVLDGEGNEQGPYSFQDLQSFYTTGNINHETMIWTEGLEEWIPAGRVEGLLPDAPQVVQLPPAAPIPVQAAPVGGINLNPQIGGITNPTLGSSTSNAIPGWISWSTILIGIVSLVLFLMPFASMSADGAVFGKEGQIEIFEQTGFQAVARKYTPNVEFIKLPLLMIGIPDKQAEEAAEKMIAEEMANEPPFERSNLAMTTLILAGVGLLLAFAGYAAQNKYLFLGAQVLFVAGAGILYIQTAREFPAVATMKEELVKEARQSVEAANAASVSGKPQGEEIAGEEVAKEGDDPAEEAEEVAETDETEDSGETVEVEAVSKKTEVAKEEVEADAIKLLDKNFQSKIEPACYVTMSLMGISFLFAIVMMAKGGNSPKGLPQPLATPQPQPQPGGFRLQ